MLLVGDYDMGFLSLRWALAGSVALAMPALADQPKPQPRPSVEGYLCTFAGKCGPQASDPTVTRDAPETKGFRLARPTADKSATTVSSPRANAVATSTRPGRRDNRAAAGRRKAGREAAWLAPTPPVPAYSAAQARQYGNGQSGAARRADLMIGFDLNSATISGEGRASASVFAQSLLRPELSGKKFVIEGHTDLRGGRQINLALSARRAQAVADFLAARGVDRSRLVTRGVGPDVPLAGHAATDPRNRRVEAALLP
ncbi:OmpA family protein [Sphingomonas sp. PB4P5]|uniref:OmpA family protein n=1 Tax=Parasphingomonas puruogangriensis TaxID=3096155 RepID=UPI002FCAD390